MNRLPSELKQPRGWRTRKDPIDPEDWTAIAAALEDAPELEAKTLFEELLQSRPGRYEPGVLRTLQRRVRLWRAQAGPDKEVFFSQVHRPGEVAQTDFTSANELGITIAGEPFPHMLCQFVLPYSNWQWATVCQSESMSAIRRGVQAAVFRLGRVPLFHQTDNSTAATHDLPSGKRDFNEDYLALMHHLGMTPRTIPVGLKNQNGDVEAAQNSLKRRLKQHLLLRRSRDFSSREAYECWVKGILEKANALRTKRVCEDLDAMRPVIVGRLAEYREREVRVTQWSTIRVENNTYSVPARLIGELLKARVHDERIEVWFRDRMELSVERLPGRNGNDINYRHIIRSLVRKPGAFDRYRYREALFPKLVFRRAYDRLQEFRAGRAADIEYLRILHLAATTMESDVANALAEMLETGEVLDAAAVKARVKPEEAVAVPILARPEVRLGEYDQLLAQGGIQ